MGVSAVLFVFSKIYTHFSFGQSSPYMNNMFLITLFGGLIALLIQLAVIGYKKVFKAAYNLWNSGLACIVAGMLIRGIINISGRTTTADRYYMYVGAAFLIASALVFFLHLVVLKIK